MDKEGAKKNTEAVKAGYWRNISEIPYLELYRIILSMEEMRLEELEDLKEYLKSQATEMIEENPKDSILGRFYVRKSIYGSTKELYHVLRVDGDNMRIIGSYVSLEIKTNNGYEFGINVNELREETQIFSDSSYWEIKGSKIKYDSEKNYIVEEISEAKFLEVWTFAKQMFLIYGKL